MEPTKDKQSTNNKKNKAREPFIRNFRALRKSYVRRARINDQARVLCKSRLILFRINSLNVTCANRTMNRTRLITSI